MLLNYLLIAFYNLKRQPVFSAIKVLSLAIGLGCSILVIMHVQYARSYDKHIPNWDRTFRIVSHLMNEEPVDFPWASNAYAPALRKDYSQIELIGNVQPGRGFFGRDGNALANDYHWAEPDIIDIFGLEFRSGDPDTALDEPNSIVLNESAATRYFPGEDALGQTLTMDERTELRVTGVYRDLPINTHIDLQMLISVATGKQLFGENFMGGNFWVLFGATTTYLRLPSAREATTLGADMPAFIQRNIPDEQRDYAEGAQLRITLQPIGEAYLSPLEGFSTKNNRARILQGLSIFAVLILLTSCINFANLSLAQVQQRNKEIGVRKALGAKGGQIVIQFLFESLLLTFGALILVLPIIWYAIPAYTTLTGTKFTIATILENGTALLLLAFVLLTGTLSGLIPAVVLSRFEPAAIIRGAGLRGRLGAALRFAVTVVQFGFSSVLIIMALAIGMQIRHLNTMDLGFNKSGLIVLDSTYNASEPDNFDYDAMVNELLTHPGIQAASKSGTTPPGTGPYNPWRRPSYGPDESNPVSHVVVGPEYFDVMQFRLIAGRWFSRDFPSEFMRLQPPPAPGQPPPPPLPSATYGVVITRAAVSTFGFESPEAALDQIIMLGNNTPTPGQPIIDYRVIGVIEDFRMSGGLEDPVFSIRIFRSTQDSLRTLVLRIAPGQADSALAHIDTVWAQHRPDVPVNRAFYEQTFDGLVYQETNGISAAALLASVITIAISAFGLYALAFYATLGRTKEIGIRKVAGATTKKIIMLLTWDFLKPVLVACALASIVGHFAASRYFEQFSSRTALPLWLYVVVAAGTLVVAIVTVASQCYRAANADPVRSLRYE